MTYFQLSFLLPFFFLFFSSIESSKCKNPIIYNFGDSNSDTGGLLAGLGFPINLPNGRIFFHRSTGRLSDGRLVIDFLCASLNSRNLSPYLEPLGSYFGNGANFAVIGSATLPEYVPFNLNIQVLQFLRYKSRTLEITDPGLIYSVEKRFRTALYAFDIGQNDLSRAFSANLRVAQVIERVPSFLTEIKNAIKKIYENGGKNFWIHNTGPLGCLPEQLTLHSRDNKDLDPHGCLWSLNDAAKAFNAGLYDLVEEMRFEMKNTTIVYVDIYAIKYHLFANFAQYGFTNPLMACCGFGGPPYNYNINITCGVPGHQVCKEGPRHISWDGIHYTEAANAIVASKILSTQYSIPQLKFDYFCDA